MSNITIVDSTMINVLNYSSSKISLPTQINKDGYIFEPATNGEPSLIPLSYAEIRYANSQSQIFREGHLRFDKYIEAEVYEALPIRNWEDILSDEEIKNILLHPTKDNLEKILNITSIASFDRVRGVMTSLTNLGMHDISSRVVDLVNNRYKEIYNGKRKSDIVINKTQQEITNSIQADVVSIEMAKVKAELEKKIRAEIEAEMKANIKVEPLLEVAEVKVESNPKVEPKKAGRPAKS